MKKMKFKSVSIVFFMMMSSLNAQEFQEPDVESTEPEIILPVQKAPERNAPDFLKPQGITKYSPWHFAVSPFTTTRWGQQKEFVYSKNFDGDLVTLSQLDWDEKPIFFFGAQGDAGYKIVNGNFRAEIAVPGLFYPNTGKMYDSDWQNKPLLTSSDPLYGVKTDYSTHTNYVDFYYILSGGFSCDFDFNLEKFNISKITLSPSANLEYSYSSFFGKDGIGYYASAGLGESFGHPYTEWETYGQKVDFSGQEVIQLERIIYKTWLGLSASAEFNNGFSAGLSFAVCPYVSLQSLDSHFTRDLFFLDTLSEYFNGLKFEVTAAKKFTKHHSLFIKAEYEYIAEFDGTTQQANGDKNGIYFLLSDTSGAAFEWFEFTLGYKFSF